MSLIVTFMVNSGLSSWRMVLMPLLSRLLTLLVILTMPLFLARLTLIPIKSLSICFRVIRISITTISKLRCCHLKNIWTAPLPPETELSRQMTTSTTSIDSMGLQAAYANLHTDQERDYFMQRYHDVISSFGGKTSYDADNRPLLVMRSNLWASGYDVDGTDQTSLGQFSGRVQQTYKHSVPRFFVPEHGTMSTLALVRFPPTATKEIQYLNAKGALTYTDIAGDPVLYGNLPPREISMKDVFRSGDSSKKFKIAEGQWYRYAT